MKRVMSAMILTGGLMAGLPAGAAEVNLEHGKVLVETNCATCHAIGKDDKSTLEKAPAFRDLAKRYPIDALEEAFAEGIVTGHEGMPEFTATPDQIADIVAYIGSIQPE